MHVSLKTLPLLLFAAILWTTSRSRANEGKWIADLTKSGRAVEATRILAELNSMPPGEGFDRQQRLFQLLDPPLPLHDETLEALNGVVGAGTSAELLAQQLFWLPGPGGMRIAADGAVARRLSDMGKRALPAMYRLLWTSERPVRMAWFEITLLEAIGRTGDQDALRELVRWGTNAKESREDYLEAAFLEMGYRAFPGIAEYVRHPHDKVRTAVWNAIQQLTMQDTPRGENNAPALPALPEDATERLRRWWEQRGQMYDTLPSEKSMLEGAAVNGLALVIPEVQLAVHAPSTKEWPQAAATPPHVRSDLICKTGPGTSIRVATSHFAHRHLTLQTPSAKTVELRQVPADAKTIERVMAREKRSLTTEVHRSATEFLFGTAVFPTSMWYRRADGSKASDVLDEPGRYRVRVTFEVPQGAPGDWHGRAESAWTTLWVIEPDEWKR